MDTQNNRASLLEIDDAPLASVDPMPSPVKPGEVSEIAKARIIGQSDTLKAGGFVLPDGDSEGKTEVGFAYGRRVLEIGDANLKASHDKWEALPDTIPALEGLKADVISERRQNIRGVPLASMLYTAGVLTFDTAEGARRVRPTRTGWRHLAEILAPSSGLVRYLPNAPESVKAEIIAAHARTATGTVSVGFKGSTGALYRVGSDTYAPYEPDRCIGDILSDPDFCRMMGGSKVEIVYTGESARIRILWHADEIPDAASGDTFKVGAEISLNDVKAGAIEVSLLAYRNECQNFIIVSELKSTQVKARHRGNVARLATRVVDALHNAGKVFESDFLAPWRAARKENILNGFSGDPKAVFEGLVGSGLVSMPGTRETQVARLLSAWQVEPGPTKADILNAITRAAHTGGWWESVEEQSETEAMAGKVLYVSNLTAKLESGFARFHKSDD